MAIHRRVPILLGPMGRTQQTFVRGVGNIVEFRNSQSGKDPRTGGGLTCSQISFYVRFCFAPHLPLFVVVREAALFLPLIVSGHALQKNIKRISTEDG